MTFTETRVRGAYLIAVEKREDERGYFGRAWCANEFAQHGLNARLVQANIGFSVRRGTLRGMHYQEAPAAEVKLVRCTSGAIWDAVVDLRPDSPTYCGWFGAELTAGNGLALYIPEGCAHGYLSLSVGAQMMYHTSEYYSREHARGVRFDDEAFGIEWPEPVQVISDQDRNWPKYAIVPKAVAAAGSRTGRQA